jgi:hypothetical protein
MVHGWIEVALNPSLNSPLRDKVAALLPNLKSGGTFKGLGSVVEDVDTVCRGGFYREGGESPTLRTTWSSLSDAEKQKLNEHYLTKVKQFEASLRQSRAN